MYHFPSEYAAPQFAQNSTQDSFGRTDTYNPDVYQSVQNMFATANGTNSIVQSYNSQYPQYSYQHGQGVQQYSQVNYPNVTPNLQSVTDRNASFQSQFPAGFHDANSQNLAMADRLNSSMLSTPQYRYPNMFDSDNAETESNSSYRTFTNQDDASSGYRSNNESLLNNSFATGYISDSSTSSMNRNFQNLQRHSTPMREPETSRFPNGSQGAGASFDRRLPMNSSSNVSLDDWAKMPSDSGHGAGDSNKLGSFSGSGNINNRGFRNQDLSSSSAFNSGTDSAGNDSGAKFNQSSSNSSVHSRLSFNPNNNSNQSRSFQNQHQTQTSSDCQALNSGVALDSFNCDLYVTVSRDGTLAYDLGAKAFQNLWGGIRATHGLIAGKAAFEVTLLEDLPVEFEESEKSMGGAPHVTRVGWSEDFTELNLGEVADSFGYGGTGKKSTRRQFNDYGIKFGVGDTVTCYLDKKESGGHGEISYAVNGRFLGMAFVLNKSNKPLFPHIASKNMKYSVNFGSKPPAYPLRPGYEMIDFCDQLQPAVKSGESAEDYEWNMFVGLPAAGKTTYIEDFVKQNPEKKYVVLGTNAIIDKMRVSNLLRKNNYHERWEHLFQRANEILKTMFQFSEHKLRNYILDQTNVYQSARIRKKKHYNGYQCNCYVLVCGPDELERRTLKTGRESGKWVPVTAVMDMKKNFTLPNANKERWNNVYYVEMDEEESKPIVAEYNNEGRLFFQNGENNLAENKEAPHPKYKRMVEDDPRGLKDPGPPPKRSRIEMPSDKPSPGFDARSAISATRLRADSAGSSSNESDYQLTSRYPKDASVEKKPDISKCNPFKAKTAAPFRQENNERPQNEQFGPISSYASNQDQPNKFPQSRWNSDQRSESNNLTRYHNNQGSHESIKEEVKLEPETSRFQGGFKIPPAPLPIISKAAQPPPFRAQGTANTRPPFASRPPFQRPPIGMKFPDVKQEEPKPDLDRTGNVPPFPRPFPGSGSSGESFRPSRPPFQVSIRPVRPNMSQRPFQPQGARFQSSQHRQGVYNSPDTYGGANPGNRAGFYENGSNSQFGFRNESSTSYGNESSVETSLGEGVGVGIKLEPDFFDQ